MSEKQLELTADNLQRMSDGIRKLYVRCEMFGLRLLFVEVVPTADSMEELLAELHELRDNADAIGEKQEWMAWFARAAAKQDTLNQIPTEFSSVHEWAYCVAGRFVCALMWHGQYKVRPPELIDWQPPANLAAINVDVVGLITREHRESFSIENLESVLQREAAVAQLELTENKDSGDTRIQVLRAVVGGDHDEIVGVVESGEHTVDDKLRHICAIDTKYLAWDSTQWADLLNVSSAAIRRTAFWKNDRKAAIAVDIRGPD